MHFYPQISILISRLYLICLIALLLFKSNIFWELGKGVVNLKLVPMEGVTEDLIPVDADWKELKKIKLIEQRNDNFEKLQYIELI